MDNCKNCSQTINGNYCSNCGQPVKLKRIDRHYITHEIEHVLHFERGIFYTIKELLKNPGQNVRNYISDNRSRLVKPIIFIIITSLIYSIINHFFHIEDGYMKFEESKKTATSSIFEWIQGHYGYANIMMGVFIAFWAKLFFKKYDYNFFEILILLCFVMGMGMLIFSFFALIEGLTHINLMQVAGAVGMVYTIWAIGHFFDKRKAINYLKAFLSYMLGTLSFFLLVFAIGIIFELAIKH